MKCEKALELMSAALDGELTPAERNALDAHLADCPHCAALYEELSGQSRLLRELDCDVPEDLSQRILSQLPQQTAAPAEKRRPVVRWKKWGVLAACAALVLWAGLTMPSHLRMGSSGSSGSAAPADAASGDTADENGGSLEEYSGGTDGTDQTTGDSPNDTAPAPAAIDPGEDLGADGSAKAASLSAVYLPVTWTEDEDPAAQLIASADDLAALLAQYPDDDLLDAASQYDSAFFERAQLIAVTLTEPSGSISHTAEAVRLTDSGYEVVICRTVPEVCTDDMAAWLILIETDLGIGPSDEISVVLAP
jgi:hypothetical protein